jgi:hypothetical protein
MSDAATENQHTKSYASLADMPPEVLASRVVGSLILAKGNLNKYDEILTRAFAILKVELESKRRACVARCATICESAAAELKQGCENSYTSDDSTAQGLADSIRAEFPECFQ